MSKIYPVIMAGGRGSRLWPLSRELFPKQFLRLHDNDSMLQTTIKRLDELAIDIHAPLVISNEEHRFIVAEQLREIGRLSHNIILEPVGRNTAAAVALAALTLIKDDPDALMLVLAADHIIKEKDAFYQAIGDAVSCAMQGKLVTFGIVPEYAETGYGYIKKGESIANAKSYDVACFVEKPNKETAEHYVNSGDYLWNSGLFLFKASRYLDELEKYRADILLTCASALNHAKPDMDFIRVDEAIFTTCPSESIDYAVMEKTQDAVVIPMNAGWSDVGSWASLWSISKKDEQNNVVKGDVVHVDTTESYLHSDGVLLTTIGVNNLVIVCSKDVVMVMDKAHCQDIKLIIDKLKQAKRKESAFHRETYRPWGKYDELDRGPRYAVKRITVKPNGKVISQMHHHRAEHWVVVAGTARVTIEDNVQLITENQSIYIPVGARHTLENPGKVDLDIIEIQSGNYLDENDITRFSDDD